MGVPTICLSRDERELTHVFCSEAAGFINLGLGVNVDETEIGEQFVSLVNNFDQRIEMNKRMLSIDLKNGFDNISSTIKAEYRRFKLRK